MSNRSTSRTASTKLVVAFLVLMTLCTISAWVFHRFNGVPALLFLGAVVALISAPFAGLTGNRTPTR